LATPLRERDVLSTGPGPDAGGSKPVRNGWAQMPEKSGMDLAVGEALLAGLGSAGAGWLKAGVAIAVNATHRSKSHGRALMIVFLSKRANPHPDIVSLQKSALFAVGTGSAS
jgi:hypothetical protein